MSLKVILQNDLNNTNIPSEQDFQKWVDRIFQHIETDALENASEVCIRIVDSEESATLNEHFRKKIGPTNILSFPSDIPMELDSSLGDMAICADLVATEAKDLGIPINDHWAHLTVHGILHLLGHDHINDDDAKAMESLEIKILETFNIKNPYEDKTHE